MYLQVLHRNALLKGTLLQIEKVPDGFPVSAWLGNNLQMLLYQKTWLKYNPPLLLLQKTGFPEKKHDLHDIHFLPLSGFLQFLHTVSGLILPDVHTDISAV